MRTEHGVSEPVTIAPARRGPSGRRRRAVAGRRSRTPRAARPPDGARRGDVRRASTATGAGLPPVPAAWGTRRGRAAGRLDARTGRADSTERARAPGRTSRRGAAGLPARRSRCPRRLQFATSSCGSAAAAGEALDALLNATSRSAISASSSSTPTCGPPRSPRSTATPAPPGPRPGRPGPARPQLARPSAPSPACGCAPPRHRGPRPRELTLTWPGGRREVTLDDDGRARFPAVRTDQLRIRVGEADPAISLDFDRARPSAVGISELRSPGRAVRPARPADDADRAPCGSGPALCVNGRPSRPASSPPRAALRRATVPATSAVGGARAGVDTARPAAGTNEVAARHRAFCRVAGAPRRRRGDRRRCVAPPRRRVHACGP